MWGMLDKGTGLNNLQSILFAGYLDVVMDGINGINCVVSGCTVGSSAGMTPSVSKGAVVSNGTLFAVAAGNATITTADGTNPRLDLVVITSAGAIAVRAGAAAASPKPPTRTLNDVVLAVVYVPANSTAIAANQLVELRMVRDRNVTLKRTTAAVTFNTNSTIQTYFTVTLPSGLFLAGKQVRVRCGGNYLSNSGTPTWTLTIAYGGSTLFTDVTTATTSDTDRGAWGVDFVLNASGNAAQQAAGHVLFQTPGVKAAAPAGIGDMGVTTSLSLPFRGTSAVDSDAGNQDLTVQWTMSGSNVSVETVMDYGYAELI